MKQGAVEFIDCTITNQYGESVNLISLVAQIEIFENISEFFLSGGLTMFDGVEIPKNYRMTGQESLTMRFRQDREDAKIVEKVFRVYKIIDLRPSERIKKFQIRFIDPYYFKFQRTIIDKTFRGSYNSMLTKVCENEGGLTIDKFAYLEKTKPENKQLICRKWNINKFINFIVNESDADYSEGSSEVSKTFGQNCFFYQTLMSDDSTVIPHGAFHFKSFDVMMNNVFEPPIKLHYNPQTQSIKGGVEEVLNPNNPGETNSQILKYKIPQKFDTVFGTTSGLYCSRQFTFDLLRGVFETYDYSIADIYKRGSHLSPNAPIRLGQPEKTFIAETSNVIGKEIESEEVGGLEVVSPEEAPESVYHLKYNSTNQFSQESSIIDYTQTTTEDQPVGVEQRSSDMLERNALMALLSYNTVIITIPFRDDIQVGQVLTATLPITEDSDNADNKLDTGQYIVTDMKYLFTLNKARGQITLKLVKEGFDTDIESYTPDRGSE